MSHKMSNEIPLVVFRSQLREPQDITHREAAALGDGKPVGSIVDDDVSHAITPEGDVWAVAHEPAEWIGRLA